MANSSSLLLTRERLNPHLPSLPLISVSSICETSRPKFLQYEGVLSRAFVTSALWHYQYDPRKSIELCWDLGIAHGAMVDIVRHYGFGRRKHTVLGQGSIPHATIDRAAKLYAKYRSAEKAARLVGHDASAIRKHLETLGVYKRPEQLSVKWTTNYGAISTDAIASYAVYCRTVRHYTNRIVDAWSHVLDPHGKRSRKFHIDHLVSVRDGFHSAERQIPWFLLCHPANLVLVRMEDNASKGRTSLITLKQLRARIREFENKHGKVLIPVGTNSPERHNRKTRVVLSLEEKISKAAHFERSELNTIAKNPVARPDSPSRRHYEHRHYAYFVSLFLRKWTINEIAREFGTSTKVVSGLLRRSGFSFEPSMEDVIEIQRLRADGYSISSINNDTGYSYPLIFSALTRFKESYHG